ncbi:hypothetical protein P692DRAFT_20854560 [Suillus brevipes Sb2]|nr:hypothetical protein P692DRAFT_20854560 [Suillus brevipes Sb2]
MRRWSGIRTTMSGLLYVQVTFCCPLILQVRRHSRIKEGLNLASSGIGWLWSLPDFVARRPLCCVAVSDAPQVPVYEVIDSSGLNLNVRSQRTPSSKPSKAMLDIQPKTSVSRPPAHTYSQIRRRSFKSPMAN